jgi:hypothetical protein
MRTAMRFGEAVKGRDQVSHTCRDAVDKVLRKEELRRAFLARAKTSLGIQPKLFGPG